MLAQTPPFEAEIYNTGIKETYLYQRAIEKIKRKSPLSLSAAQQSMQSSVLTAACAEKLFCWYNSALGCAYRLSRKAAVPQLPPNESHRAFTISFVLGN